MKREILFKGIVIDDGCIFHEDWFYGDLIQYVDGTFYIRQVETNSMLQVHPETVCQFTGLLDKNGNKIFEGDYDQNYEVVKWCEKRNGYALYTYDHPTNDFIHCNCYCCEGHYEIADVINESEIIGNIHDK